MVTDYIKSGGGQASGLDLRLLQATDKRTSAPVFPAYRGPWYTLCLPDAMVIKSRNRV